MSSQKNIFINKVRLTTNELIIFFSIIFFLPLQNILFFSTQNTRLLWNGFPIILSAFLIFFLIKLLPGIKKRPTKLIVQIFIFFLLSLLISILFGRNFSIDFNQLILLFSAAAMVPVSYTVWQRKPYVFWLVITGIAALHAQWAILQFSLQHDLGFQILGETDINVNTNGIAKFFAGDTKLIRAYGPYAHPNIMAGSLLILLTLSLHFFLQHNGAQKNPAKRTQVLLHSSHALILPIYALIILAILLSFSKAAWIGLILLLAQTGSFFRWPKIIKQLSLVFLVTSFVISPLIYYRLADKEDLGMQDRYTSLEWASRLLTRDNVLRGVGIGNYKQELTKLLQRSGIEYLPWQIAPLHSAPLLALIELGFIPFVTLSILLTLLLGKNIVLLLPTLPLLLFDHYLYTMAAPMIFMAILIALASQKKESRN